jgi:hypothetical protein
LLLVCALLLAATLHLFFPDRHENRRAVRFTPLLSYAYNGDSSEYARLVATFPRDFQEHGSRLLRPLYSLMGWLVYQPLRVLRPLVPEGLCQRAAAAMAAAGGDRTWAGLDARDLVLAWAALLIVGFAIYASSLVLIYLALGRIFEPRLALLLSLFPALHRNVIDFILVPAADPFNLLLPAIFFYTAAVVWSERRAGLASAFALGIGVLGKGILHPICNWGYEHLVIRDWRKEWRTALLCGGLFVAPMLAYLALLCLPGMPDWRRDVNIQRDRSFVWMVDYLRAGLFVEIPRRWMVQLAGQVQSLRAGWTAPLCLGLLVALRSDRRPLLVDRNLRRHLVVYSACTAAFFVLGPFPYFRLSICYYPAVIVLLGVLVVRKTARPAAWLLVGLAAHVLTFVVVNRFL